MGSLRRTGLKWLLVKVNFDRMPLRASSTWTFVKRLGLTFCTRQKRLIIKHLLGQLDDFNRVFVYRYRLTRIGKQEFSYRASYLNPVKVVELVHFDGPPFQTRPMYRFQRNAIIVILWWRPWKIGITLWEVFISELLSTPQFSWRSEASSHNKSNLL